MENGCVLKGADILECEIIDCEYCKKRKQLLSREVPHVIWGQYAFDTEMQVIVDRGYLRLGFTDDMQCMDHGEKIKINYCPMCGEKF